MRAAGLLLPVLLGAAACDRPVPGTGARAAIEVTDDAGVVVRLAAPAERVVSLVPARTDAIVALGAADRLVARTRWDEHPELAALPSLQDALTPSVEWLVSRRPDLVIAWPDVQTRDVVTRLRSLGIPVYASGVETLADLRRALADLGALLGREAAADSLVARIDAVLDSVRTEAAGRPRLRAVYVIGLDPASVAGPGTFVDEVLAAAGADNVFGDAGRPWPQVGIEAVLARNPEVVISSAGPGNGPQALARLRATPGWRDLPAVREGRVFHVDGDVVNRPGPGVVLAARAFAAILAEAAGLERPAGP